MKSIQPKSDRHRINIYLSEETKTWLVEQTQRLNMSQSQFVILLIEKMKRSHNRIHFKDLD